MPKPYKTITLRLNADEYAHLQAQAGATGLKMEPLLRQLIMGVELRPVPPTPTPPFSGNCPPSEITSISLPIRPTPEGRPPGTRSPRPPALCGKWPGW